MSCHIEIDNDRLLSLCRQHVCDLTKIYNPFASNTLRWPLPSASRFANNSGYEYFVNGNKESEEEKKDGLSIWRFWRY
jgi:hypothetical protein